MALTPAQRDALTVALHGARHDVRERLVKYASTMWDTLGDWRDDDIARFVAAVAPRIEAGKATVARLTDAYIAALLDDDPAGVTNLSGIRGGVTPQQVYRRPAVTMRTELAGGATFTDALEAGRRRLESLVSTDLELAHTHQARHTMTTPGRRRRGRRGQVEAFRRVPSGRETCALCLIASTQRYWVGDLMPIHPGCDCGVETLGVGEHVDQVIDPDLLEAVHKQVEQLTGGSDRGGRDTDYRDLIVTRQHGEYGPTIAWRGQKFTGPDQLAAPIPDPEPETSSWLFDSIAGERLADWASEDLRDLYNEAVDANDPQALAFLSKELERREKQSAGYRGTGYTRAELRVQYTEWVDRSYWQAEAATNGHLLNAEGLRAGIDPRSLFTGTEARAKKYASTDLLYHWQDQPRLSFDGWIGDQDARAAAEKMEF